MAPLFVAAQQLSRCYSPLSSRKLNHLPGNGWRSVPFVRPCQPLSRLESAVRAVSEEVVADEEPEVGNGNGAAQRERHSKFLPSTQSVHGGERAGRPRVSGKRGGGGMPSHRMREAGRASRRRRQGSPRVQWVRQQRQGGLLPGLRWCLGGSCRGR